MAIFSKDSYKVGIDHNIAKSTAFISNQQNKPVESIDIRMSDKSLNSTKHYFLNISYVKYRFDMNNDLISEVTKTESVPLSVGKIDFIKRADIIGQTITDFIKSFNNDVIPGKEFSRLALEGYSRRASSDKFNMAEVTGILKLKLRHAGYADIYLVPPTSLKTFIADFGHADKDVMADHMLLKFGFVFENDDLNDAFLLSIYEEVKKNGNKKTA